MVLGTLHDFDGLGDFTDLFPDAQTGNQAGTWRFDTGGSTGSTGTGPGTNNVLPFMHTETSGTDPFTTVEMRGVATMDPAAIPTEAGRTLHIRACIQGGFADGTEGLEIQERAGDGDPWVIAGFIHGWAYSDDYVSGTPITDENDVGRVIAADGGWIDFDVDVADDTTQIQLIPQYIVMQSSFLHDIAVRSMQWEWPGSVVEERVRTAITSGVPVLTARVRATRMARIRSSIMSGVPALTARVRTSQQSARVRAAISSGVPALTARVRLFRVGAPGAPQFARATVLTEASAEVNWEAPADDGGEAITGYEVSVIHEDGTEDAYEQAGLETRYTVRGLARDHRYGFRVRAVSAIGTGPASDPVYAELTVAAAPAVADGDVIPLIFADRQSLIVRLGDIDCRVRTWWQPSDEAWYGSIEVPVNTPGTRGIRLAVGAGLLDRRPELLPGNVVCRAFSTDFATDEPARDAWVVPTHLLIWEPAG